MVIRRTSLEKTILRALPINPEDDCCIIRYSNHSSSNGHTYSTPLWGHPSTLVHLIACAVAEFIRDSGHGEILDYKKG